MADNLTPQPRRETVEIQKQLFDAGKSKLQKYKEIVLGEASIWYLIKYELIMLLASWLPGALGLVLRSRLYPTLLGRTGRNVTFGCNVVLRHPRKIHLGDNVVIDDNVVLDAKGSDNQGLFIGNGVFVGRNTILSCKNGDILIDDHANLGFNCEIFSASRVHVGKNVLLAAYVYLVGGTHTFARRDIPIIAQERISHGITVGDNSWLGAHVVVFDGVTIGSECIIGAGAVVSRNVPDWQIAVGVPAKVVKDRREMTARVETV
ncbi:MAG: acyltransferase [candidate division KSB1 bacterium]|nr:acyltransferase [candidate division KSB1 bacterium]MDZ7276001.1 acyltransferase [candidate division KSB1 bacterium]MDZ7285717.1 acyltransferase [candidate division KSB1 bacterium]MDZ7298749.1 acyltransferase [candidate division KSB1 bacterium]MDZ7305932.1 acyltransferase [candidate division KSB1 bacterium]